MLAQLQGLLVADRCPSSTAVASIALLLLASDYIRHNLCRARGSAWYATQNHRIWKHVAGLVRYVPFLIWGLNVILMVLLIVAGFLFWGVGVCVSRRRCCSCCYCCFTRLCSLHPGLLLRSLPVASKLPPAALRPCALHCCSPCRPTRPTSKAAC